MHPIVLLALCVVPQNPGDDIKPAVTKGLDFLAKQQAADGSWSALGGQYPVAITSLAATALYLEGSTQKEGKYAPHLRKAIDWLSNQARPNGLLVTNTLGDQSRYLISHGYALMFLSLVYGEEEDRDRRAKLEKILTKAVTFAGTAQTKRGGWGYVAAAEGSDFDEGHVTIVVLHGIRAARTAGIPVPKPLLDGANKYLDDSTTQNGGVLYSLASGPGGPARPVITAGAAAVAYGTQHPRYAAWVKYAAQTHSPDVAGRRDGYGLLGQFYFARVAYHLGTEGHKKLAPMLKESELVTWPTYRKTLFDGLKKLQQADGSWEDRSVGPVFGTSLALIILQLENQTVPFFSR